MIMQIVIKALLVNILFMACLSLFFKIISIFVCPSVSDQIYSNILGWRRSCWVVCLIVDYLDLWLVGVFIWLDRASLYAEVDILMSPIFLVSFIYEKHVPSELVGVFSVFLVILFIKHAVWFLYGSDWKFITHRNFYRGTLPKAFYVAVLALATYQT